MKIKNPNFVSPATAKITAHKAKIQAFLVAQAGKDYVDFDAIRAAHPAFADELTDGVIAEVAASLGLKVEA